MERALAIRGTCPPGARISFVSGNFNIVHPGHLRLLKFAADMADCLVVGLNPDNAPGVTVPIAMRLEGVKALSIVHHAFPLEDEVAKFLACLKPDFVVKGKEFENRINIEASVIEPYGGKLIFSSGDAQFGSTDLLLREFSKRSTLTLRKANGFPERHRLDTSALRASLRKLSEMRVAVIGDLIVDEYIDCEPLGMSQEDPTIVVSPIESRTFVGGAGVVAAHANNLGAQTHLFTVTGADETARYANSALKQLGISVQSIVDETRPTTRKQRYRALSKTMLRVTHLRQHAISKEHIDKMLDGVLAVLPEIDLLMFSDFNYGCLPQELVKSIAEAARARGVMMTADSQSSSQMSDIARFKGMELITPTEREARIALRDNMSGLAILAAELCSAASAKNVIITLGADGMMVHGRDGGGDYFTDRLPALNSTPQDVAGAGDTLFTAASMALCSGADIWLSSYLGAVAAALQTSRLGNIPLELGDILRELDQIDRS